MRTLLVVRLANFFYYLYAAPTRLCRCNTNTCAILSPYFGSPGLQQMLQALIVFTLHGRKLAMAEDGASPVDLSLYGDIVVLDLTSNIRGMHCAKLFADYGAEVILVEPLEGSRARGIGPFANGRQDRETSLHFIHHNRNK